MKLLAILFLLQVPLVSKFLSYREAVQSAHVGPTQSVSANTPDARQLALIQRFGREYFDPLRVRVGTPLYVSSLFRSPALNKRVGGAASSDHMILKDVVGCDIDQDNKGKISNRALFFIMKDETQYRKLIWEFGTITKPQWVHVSWSSDPKKNIKKVYRAIKIGNRTVYQVFSDINHI